METNEIAKVIAEIISDEFESIREAYENEGAQGIQDIIYEALQNCE